MMDATDRILELKEEKNAVILAHNYQIPEVQDIADYLGDSLGLSRKAAQSDAGLIVFCGVKFMAETAKILSPEKMVLMPEGSAGCPMAEMISVDGLRKLKGEHPGAATVGYVNTNAEVKAEVDVCCTSANAVKIVESLSESEVIFVPDKYLGDYVAKHVDKELILWNGFCPTHMKITVPELERQLSLHPGAEVMVHPECTPDVIEIADHVFSTGGMVAYPGNSGADEFIVGTEVGIIHRLSKENPGKKFYPASDLAVCPNMKKTTLESVLSCLEDGGDEVTVPDTIASRARGAIERMVEII